MRITVKKTCTVDSFRNNILAISAILASLSKIFLKISLLSSINSSIVWLV